MIRGRVLVVCLALTACNDKDPIPPGSGSGSLVVTVTGLPTGAQASVTVARDGRTETLTGSRTLQPIEAGTYTIAAANVTAAGMIYVPTPALQTVSVASRSETSATVAYSSNPDNVTLAFETVATGLTAPVYVTSPANDPRLFIVEQNGRVRILANGTLLSTPFLDIRSRVSYSGERGLLSIAFHPQYATNGFFFVNFTDVDGNTRVERFRVSSNPDVADGASTTLVLGVTQPFANHNGGQLQFGPDGFLYIGMGDGGSGGDPQGNGQNRNTLLGKMLRIDVNTLPYVVPSSNPFVGQSGVRPEIWALGLRNPWRFSFDRQAGHLYIADVGQGQREEVNVVSAAQGGQNYGWATMEGTVCYNAQTCSQTGLTLPVVDYTHADGCSITGGYVYRGTRIPEIAGRYFYTDYCNGWLRSFRFANGAVTASREWPVARLNNPTSFGEDSSGEMYVTLSSGTVMRLVRR